LNYIYPLEHSTTGPRTHDETKVTYLHERQ